jgi:hypothetical protein
MVKDSCASVSALTKSPPKRTGKASAITKRSKGRPMKEETTIILIFISKSKKPVKLEVLNNCIIRRILRKIDKVSQGKDEDRKLIQIKPYIVTVETLIESNRPELVSYIDKWHSKLNRKERCKNRQYNQKEINSLLSSELVFRIYNAYIEGILQCSDEQVKSHTLNLAYWPKGGNQALRRLFLPANLSEESCETEAEREAIGDEALSCTEHTDLCPPKDAASLPEVTADCLGVGLLDEDWFIEDDCMGLEAIYQF